MDAAAKEFEHGSAGVDCVGVEVRIGAEKPSQKAAVSIAEDEGAFLLEELGEEVDAALFEGAAEGEVFEPAVGAGYEIEVGGCVHRGRKGMKRKGVRRTRSAAARRGKAGM